MPTGHILHLEDNDADVFLIHHMLERAGLRLTYTVASDAESYDRALADHDFDLVLSDNCIPGFGSVGALRLARDRHPDIPFICVSGAWQDHLVSDLLSAGATACILKSDHRRLAEAVADALGHRHAQREADRRRRLQSASDRLVAAVQQLSLARDFESIRAIVRRAARELVGADGATLVLRDGDQCHYVDEDAIGPLWKGKRFPLTACISGWAMLNRRSAAIRDIYADPRIPADAYRPTFVKSLVMVPIRPADPIGAIGNYWATPHTPDPAEIDLLQSLANTAAVAMENARIYADLERRVLERTRQLETSNHDLEAFSYSVSHDLRAPLHNIGLFAEFLEDDTMSSEPARRREYAGHIRRQVDNMARLIDDFLRIARLAQCELEPADLDIATLADELVDELRIHSPAHHVEFIRPAALPARADPRLLRIVLGNLLANAWKYTGRLSSGARVELGTLPAEPGAPVVYFVRDNGVGFDPRHAGKLFSPFQRLHPAKDFAGSGIGLATASRIIGRHGGRIRAESSPGEGATFFFTLEPASS